MALRFKLQLVVIADDDQQVSVDELVVLAKEHERLEHLGLSLAEVKALLLEVQRQILGRQLAAFLVSRTPCPTCGRNRGIKDHKTILFRTLFGKLEHGHGLRLGLGHGGRGPLAGQPDAHATARRAVLDGVGQPIVHHPREPSPIPSADQLA